MKVHIGKTLSHKAQICVFFDQNEQCGFYRKKKKASKLNVKKRYCSYVYSVFKMVLQSHSKIYGNILN